MREKLVFSDLSNWYEYVFVHIVFEKIAAGTASVSIKDAEIAAFGPSAFVIRFGDVHDDWDSILVIVFD